MPNDDSLWDCSEMSRKKGKYHLRLPFNFLWPCHWQNYSNNSMFFPQVHIFCSHHIPATIWWLSLQHSTSPWGCWLATWLTTYFLLDNESTYRKHPIAERLKAPRASCYHAFLCWFIFTASESSSCLRQACWTACQGMRSLWMENSCKLYRQEAEGNHLGCWCSVWGLIDWLKDPGVMRAEDHKHTNTHWYLC